MFASQEGHQEIIELLLDYNADIDLKNDYGHAAVELAWNDGIKEMIRNHVNTSYVLK